MGQYWKPIILDDDGEVIAWAYTHDYKETYTRDDGSQYTCGHGLKLLEHGYLDNDFVRAFERLLIPDGEHYGKRVVWAGDYAEEEPGSKANLWALARDEDDYEVQQGIRRNTKINLVRRPVSKTTYPYILNFDKKLFIDKRNVKGGAYWSDGEVWPLHPLTFMTLDRSSLGHGGGDLYEENASGASWPDVGSWSRDHIGVDKVVPEGFTEYVFDLSENAPNEEETKQLTAAAPLDLFEPDVKQLT